MGLRVLRGLFLSIRLLENRPGIVPGDLNRTRGMSNKFYQGVMAGITASVLFEFIVKPLFQKNSQ